MEHIDVPDIANDDGAVTVVPSIDYPKAKVEELEALAAQARADAAAGEAEAYDNVEELIADLHRTV